MKKEQSKNDYEVWVYLGSSERAIELLTDKEVAELYIGAPVQIISYLLVDRMGFTIEMMNQ